MTTLPHLTESARIAALAAGMPAEHFLQGMVHFYARAIADPEDPFRFAYCQGLRDATEIFTGMVIPEPAPEPEQEDQPVEQYIPVRDEPYEFTGTGEQPPPLGSKVEALLRYIGIKKEL